MSPSPARESPRAPPSYSASSYPWPLTSRDALDHEAVGDAVARGDVHLVAHELRQVLRQNSLEEISAGSPGLSCHRAYHVTRRAK